MFKVEFATDNAAFEGDNFEEQCAAILERVIVQLNDGFTWGYLTDWNGSNVGTWERDATEDSQ